MNKIHIFFFLFIMLSYIYYMPDFIEPTEKLIREIKYDKLIDYLKTINPYMYHKKLNLNIATKIDFDNFYKIYKSFIKKPSYEQKNILKNKIDIVNKLLSLSINWKILISKNNLEGAMPFTIDNYVILPDKLINSVSIVTLLHEKIHILQRNNQNEFNKLYKQLYPFLYLMKDHNIIPNELDKINMTNPDSNNTYWIYYIHNRLWLPLLVFDKNSNSFKEHAYPIIFNKKIIIDIYNPTNLKKLIPYMDNRISLYHPNEIFACSVSFDIIEKRPIDDRIIKLLNNYK